MDITYSSVLTTVIFCNLTLVFISLIMGRTSSIIRVGYRALLTSIIFVMLRMIFPIELLQISNNILLPEKISILLIKLEDPFFNTEFTVLNFVLGVWIFGIIVILLKTTIKYFMFLDAIKRDSVDITDREDIYVIIRKYKRKRIYRVKVLETEVVSSPIIFGIISQTVLLPKKAEFNDQEMEYVLHHEIIHYNNGDLFLKLVAILLNIVFWWNPCTKIICRRMDLLLEIRVDDMIAIDVTERINYMETLLKAEKAELIEDKTIPTMAIIGEKSAMLVRFSYMTAGQKNRLYSTLFIVLIAAITILSYVSILEPYYINPKVLQEENAVILNSENAYLIYKEDGTYDVYFEGNYFGNITEIGDDMDKIEIQ